MKLSVTSWSFPACTLPEVAGIAKALGIAAVDVGYFYASALDKAALLADPEGTAARLADQGISSPCLYHLFGDTLADRNLADPRSRERNLADFEQVAAFCRAAGIRPIFVLPGVVQPGPGPRGGAARSRPRRSQATRANGRGRGRTAHRRAPRPRLPREPDARAPAHRAGCPA